MAPKPGPVAEHPRQNGFRSIHAHGGNPPDCQHTTARKAYDMYNIVWIVGAIVIVVFLLRILGIT